MRHPRQPVLRRLGQEPAGVADVDRQHVAACAQCLGGLAAAAQDGGSHPPAEAPGGAARGATGAGARTRGALRRPAVATLAVAAVLAGAGAAAADSWFPIFRTQEVAPVGFGAADLMALPDLGALGEVVVTGEPDVRPVEDAAAAEAATGLDVPEVTTLPRGVSGVAVHQVGDQVRAEVTFSTERAARAAAAAGGTMPAPPPGLEGSTIRLVAGPGAVQVWPGATGVPSLIVGRAVAPSAFSDGVPFSTARDYGLSLPGVPQDLAAQLRTFTADGSTLPLPVDTDRMTTASVDVRGVRATVLESRDRTMAAVVWVADGVVTAVAGPLDADEVVSVARGLR